MKNEACYLCAKLMRARPANAPACERHGEMPCCALEMLRCLVCSCADPQAMLEECRALFESIDFEVDDSEEG